MNSTSDIRTSARNRSGGKLVMVLFLLAANFIYSCTSIFTKLSSLQDPLSFKYFLFVACAVCVLGIYSVLWQQIIKRLPISEAYMYKGTTLIFVLAISAVLFGEKITLQNVIGAAMIIGGIVMFSKS